MKRRKDPQSVREFFELPARKPEALAVSAPEEEVPIEEVKKVEMPEGFRAFKNAGPTARGFNPDTLDEIFQCASCQYWILCATYGDAVIDRGRWDELGYGFCEKCAGRHRPTQSKEPIKYDVPAEFTFSSVDNIEPTLRKRLLDWPSKRMFLALFGMTGSGKTYALWALRKHFAERGIYIHMYDCAALRTTWANMMPGKREHLETTLLNSRMLILDDFTKAEFTGGWAGRMETVIDQRTARHMPTIVSSMLIDDAFSERCGEAIASRMRFFHAIHFPTKDRRAEKVKH